jgi:hypothetical protein
VRYTLNVPGADIDVIVTINNKIETMNPNVIALPTIFVPVAINEIIIINVNNALRILEITNLKLSFPASVFNAGFFRSTVNEYLNESLYHSATTT